MTTTRRARRQREREKKNIILFRDRVFFLCVSFSFSVLQAGRSTFDIGTMPVKSTHGFLMDGKSAVLPSIETNDDKNNKR